VIFTPVQFGPLTLKNRVIRAAAFEGMCYGHSISDDLLRYHESIAGGGTAMTTLAYAAVSKEALSFPHQLLLDDNKLNELKQFTDLIHKHNCAASIQIGHCGNMAKSSIIGMRPVSASAHFNLYGPTFPRKASLADIKRIVNDFGNRVCLVAKAGFDAVEIHAGHGYLISQFLSSYVNKRTDEFGGNLENRMRFMTMVMEEVINRAENKIAVLVKMNMFDGFKGGMEINESIQVAQRLQEIGVHGVILSAGFVSRAPMQVMRGKMPAAIMAQGIKKIVEKFLVRFASPFLIPSVEFKENYFLESALQFRDKLKLPLIYVGGVKNEKNIEEVLNHGFDAVQVARALISDPDFVNKINKANTYRAMCDTCNECIAHMYTSKIQCKFNTTL
jgi:2,4-dienoyl-CoA reductase-like NADH-dependent reductase (Old Yellow Enzyme family)